MASATATAAPSTSEAQQMQATSVSPVLVKEFTKLRNEQRNMATKIAQLDSDRSEHRLVIDALNKVDGNRRCYRMVGGILVERTASDVLPQLEKNEVGIGKILDILSKQLEGKTADMVAFRQKHNIGMPQEGSKPQTNAASPSEHKTNDNETRGAGVLVAKE